MNETDFKKLDIACEFIDMAMQFYIEERNYFCAIHLAAAAEELLGAHLPSKERFFAFTVKAQQTLHKLKTGEEQSYSKAREFVLWSKNTIKHMDSNDTKITIDPKFEAEFWIEHALVNYSKLNIPKSQTLDSVVTR